MTAGSTVIRQEDVIASVADALQFISYYHPLDFIHAVHRAYEREESKAAKDAMAQILLNSRMCAEGKRPICQDTGIVTVFVEVGMNVRWEGTMGLEDMIRAKEVSLDANESDDAKRRDERDLQTLRALLSRREKRDVE